jgi:hypothetical protein
MGKPRLGDRSVEVHSDDSRAAAGGLGSRAFTGNDARGPADPGQPHGTGHRLGHADPSTTLRVYSHAVRSADASLAVLLGSRLDGIGSPGPDNLSS